MSKISVIMSVYNCQRFIQSSLISIDEQDFDDFEIIIVNDGSTDNTWRIVQDYKFRHKCILVDNKYNKRIPSRRNEASLLASGKYLAIHDGDDISLPDRLKKQYEFLENNDIFCVGGWAYRIDETDNETGVMNYPPLEHKDIVAAFLFKRINPIIDPSTMFRNDIFAKLGGYSLEKAIYTVPDMDLWTRGILEGYKFKSLAIPLIKYRVNSSGMTGIHKKEMGDAHNIVCSRFQERFKTSVLTEIL